MIKFAKQKGIEIVYGSNMKCAVKEYEKIVLPEGENREKFIELLKKKGLWDDWNMLSYAKVNSGILKGDVDKDIKKMIELEKSFRLSLSKRKDVGEEGE